jgi:EAL domain-containing protein (putative c-di-GMP-specific phosphodiesterase class I)/FixJ family two-component response regulator
MSPHRDTSTSVMVLDDEPFALKLLTRQLLNLGYTNVLPFERGEDALAALASCSGTVGIVCCDLQMPGMDGVEFVRRLSSVGFQGALILVSGEDARLLGSVERLAKAQRLNVLGAVRKPISPDRLREVLGTVIPTARAAAGFAPKSYELDDVRRAIEAGELVNHYQPKVSMSTGAVVGVETLVRWQHPVDGLVYPDRFIGIAEQQGLIDTLTQVVMRRALHDGAGWNTGRLRLHIAVNVSTTNLAALDFPDRVEAAAAEAKFALTGLVLEVTESQAVKNPMAVLDILTRLRLKRVVLSIDDFGTGYSSLAQLVDLPFNELKIDRGFVNGAATDAACRVVVEASLDVARRLGMSTVAEGVETESDWNSLRAAGCDMAQGYFIGRPMPAERLMSWIAGWQSRVPGLLSAGGYQGSTRV